MKMVTRITDSVKPDSEFVFLGYLSIHYTNYSTESNCGRLIKDGGIVYVEAMRYALDQINRNNSEFLWGTKARFKIIDTCRNTATLARSFTRTLETAFYIGVIGATSSDEAILAANMHAAMSVSVVSHQATSSSLDDRRIYGNLFRTVPSDSLQVKALIDIVKHFNWNYISTVSSNGEYGHQGMQSFLELAKTKKICIAKHVALPAYPKMQTYREAIKNILRTKANVVILFTLPEDTRQLMEMAGNLKVNTITWISSSGWKIYSVWSAKHAGKGALILKTHDSADSKFVQYFMNLTANNNNYTWFREFWSEVFNCSFNSPVNKCTGNESLANSTFSTKYAAVDTVLSAVESIACSLRKSMLKRCPGRNLTCLMRTKNFKFDFETDIMNFLKSGNSKCPELSHSINMNKYGYYNRDFHIFNSNGNDYVPVGVWRYNETSKQGTLQIKKSKHIVWVQNMLPSSYCSVPCKDGEIKRPGNIGGWCCFKCERCRMNEIVLNNTCIQCNEYEQADVKQAKCKVLPFTYMEIDSRAGIATVISASIGMILNTVILVTLINCRNAPIVKASSRELSLIIVIALYICFLSPFVYIMRPSFMVCGIQRFIIGVSLAACYTPLMLKTNRIYRIFAGAKKKSSRPPLISPRSQIIICSALIGMQLLLGIMWVMTDPPEVILRKTLNDNKVAVYCRTDAINIVFSLLPCLLVMAVCTFYAYKTRKIPSSFNETLSICIAMYISCFIWGVFITLVFFLQANEDVVFTMMFIIADFPIAIGFITLLGLFGPLIKKLITRNDVISTLDFFSGFPRQLTRQMTVATWTEGDISQPEQEHVRMQTIQTRDFGTNTW